ncbi:hypothetical protein DOK76_05125 [Vagococcus sp. DIV0080]|uniref:Competence protein CoiA n=1 Tax=Candidatus Vagococcus giribetii TaxID=2230876 RepID=A0ABS3HRR7_9ENTE|nr:hypothetical protein [Vagococcus sp. DIV0080]
MLVAENHLKERVNLSRLTQEEINDYKKEQWFCSACHSEVIIKNGQVIRPHFAHKARQMCEAFSENESEEHLKGKTLIATNCETYGIPYEVEAYLPELQQRPDVLINGKIAIEFQCSSLSIERFKERSEAYLAHDYQVVWLLGNNFHLKKHLSTLQKQFIYFSVSSGFYMWELDVTKETIYLDYFLTKLPLELVYKRRYFSLHHTSLIDILAFPNKQLMKENWRTLSSKNYNEQQKKWNQQLNLKQPKIMLLQSFFYEKGHNLREISDLYFFPSFLTPLLMEEELILRFLLHTYLLDKGKGNLEEILLFIKEEYSFPVFVLVGEDKLLSYCLSLYLTYLRNQGLVRVEGKTYFLVKKVNSTTTFKYEILWLPLKYGMISK